MKREWTYDKTIILTEESDYCLYRYPDGSLRAERPPQPWPDGICPATLARIDGMSNSMDEKTIYIFVWPEGFAEARFYCPCGCKGVVDLSLKPAKANNYADWDVSIHPETKLTTISPSVNQLYGCLSHYFIRDGKVIWC